MEILFSDIAKQEFLQLEKTLQLQFKKAIEKVKENPVRRHLKYGIPSHTINVGKQSRLVYNLVDGKVVILHCFQSHSDYEKWYKSYK